MLWHPPNPAEPLWKVVEGIEDGVEIASVGEMLCVRTGAGALHCLEPGFPPLPVTIAGITEAGALTTPTDGKRDLRSHQGGEAIFVLEVTGELHRIHRDPQFPFPDLYQLEPTGLDDVVALDRACALQSDGTVTCFGPLGAPNPLAGAPKARAHLSLDDGVCMIARADGAVYCERSGHPLARISHLSPARALVRHEGVCGLLEDGALRCIDREFVARSTPALRGEAIAAPSYRVFVMADGKVQYWNPVALADHREGRLPVDDAVGFERFDHDHCIRRAAGGLLCTTYDTVELPSVPVAGLEAVAELAHGERFVCARLRSGEVRCWGIVGEEGQLGDGQGEAGLSPVTVAGIDDAVDIAAGGRAACAVRMDGSVACWGNLRGLEGFELGLELEPALMPGLAGVAQVALAFVERSEWLCVRFHDGSVECASDDPDGSSASTHSGLLRIEDVEGALHLDGGEQTFAAIVAGGASREMVRWGAGVWGRTPYADRIERRSLAGLRGLDLHDHWRCADLPGPRGPTCWGFDLPRPLGTRVEDPGELFPFTRAPASSR